MKKRNINWKKLLIPIVILGGLFMVFKGLYGRPHATAEDFRTAETNLAKYIVLRYEGVEKIEFQGWGYSHETGDWGTIVIVNNENSNTISFLISELEDISILGSISYDENFNLDEKTEIQNESPVESAEKIINQSNYIDLSNVEIIYSNEGEEEEVFGF